jgi:nucleoside-diphosphate-sugar epimerase
MVMPAEAARSVPLAVVLGATGRLGPAVCRALARGGWAVRGLSRRAPTAAEGLGAIPLIVGDRRDEAALRAALEGAALVVDLIGASAEDAAALRAVLPASARHVVVVVCASSRAGVANAAGVDGAFGGAFHALVLPRLVAEVDPALRERPYLDMVRTGESAMVPAGGAARLSLVAVDDVAEVVAALAADPTIAARGPLAVAPASTVSVAQCVAALLAGAGVPARVVRHPDPHWRGPHPGVDEVLTPGRYPGVPTGIRLRDPLEVCRAHGAWLASLPPAPGRPSKSLPLASSLFHGRRETDVHGRRDGVILESPVPGLLELSSWLTPSFYVDVGRPCNSACLYCAVPPHADTQGFAPLDSLDPQIAAGVAAGCDRAILIGGEPTIYPELGALLARLRAAGVGARTILMTNGLRLADERFLASLVEGGVRTFHVSVDTADEAVYDELSRSRGRFRRQCDGLDNALRVPGANVYVYAAVTRLNAAGLPRLLDALVERAERAGRTPPPLLLAFAKPIGDALVHMNRLWVGPRERVEAVRALVAAGERRGVVVGFRNLQACLAPDLVRYNVDYYLEDYSIDLRTRARRAYAHNTEYASHVEACEGCAHRALCPGVYANEAGRPEAVAAYHAIAAEGLRFGA